MHNPKQIVDRLLEADGARLDGAGNIKEFVARRQPGSKNMENQFMVRNRARAIAGKLLDMDIGRSGR